RNAAAKSPLHRRHPWQAACGSRRPEEGHCHRGSQRLGPATLVEARRVASAQRALPIVEFIEGLLKRGENKPPSTTGSSSPAWGYAAFASDEPALSMALRYRSSRDSCSSRSSLSCLRRRKISRRTFTSKPSPLASAKTSFLPSFNALISSSMRSTRSTKEQMRSPGIPAVFVMRAPFPRGTHVCSESNREVNSRD